MFTLSMLAVGDTTYVFFLRPRFSLNAFLGLEYVVCVGWSRADSCGTFYIFLNWLGVPLIFMSVWMTMNGGLGDNKKQSQDDESFGSRYRVFGLPKPIACRQL